MTNTTEHITARLPQDVAAWLRKRSEIERRSLAFIVERALRYHMLHPELEFQNWLEDKPPLIERPLAKIERGPNGENLREMYRNGHAPTCRCYVCKPPK